MAEVITFDEILEDKAYKAEFDRRVTKALSSVQKKLDDAEKRAKKLEPLEKEAEKRAKAREERKIRLDEMRKRFAEKKENAEQDAKIADLKERFAKAKGDKEFSLDYAEQGAFNDFMKLLDDPNNKGKGDVELFDTLVKDKQGLFKSANPQGDPAKMGGVNTNTSSTELISQYKNAQQSKNAAEMSRIIRLASANKVDLNGV